MSDEAVSRHPGARWNCQQGFVVKVSGKSLAYSFDSDVVAVAHFRLQK